MTLDTFIQIALVPILTALTTYFVKWINAKTASVKAQTDNELATKYLTLLNTTISDCIVATNQTYVNSLKQQGNFTKEAQKEAFSKTFEAVQKVITQEMNTYLKSIIGDLNQYISTRIESEINTKKSESTN